MFTSHHFQRHYQNCESASTPQSGMSHKTCLRGFGGNGSIAWTSAVSHEGRTSNAFKVTMKQQTFLFQMVVTSCISVQYLWKYGFAKSSDNLHALCILCPSSIIPEKDPKFQQLDLFPSAGEILGRYLLSLGLQKEVFFGLWTSLMITAWSRKDIEESGTELLKHTRIVTHDSPFLRDICKHANKLHGAHLTRPRCEPSPPWGPNKFCRNLISP